jgi:omega-amidase
MQDTLTIALLQSDIHWHQIDANLAMFEEQIWSLEEQQDLILLPEMFNSGFTMASDEMSEVMNSKTFRWLKQQAEQAKAVITGSLIIREGRKHFNRLVWMRPDGSYEIYDKKHLFRMVGEDKHFTAGNAKIIVEVKGWKVCPLICYDLRFPVWSKNRYDREANALDYDVLLYLANWPEPRVSAWNCLLQARAIENHAYCVGLNRIGMDGHELPYNGQSAIYDPKGQELLHMSDVESARTFTLKSEPLKRYREKFPAYLDEEDFTIL